MSTLADMPPEQRAQSVGLWCDYRGGRTVSRGVIYRIPLNEGHGSVDVLRMPQIDRGNPITPGRYFDEITPLPDLPRAWTPEGDPVPGRWEKAQDAVLDEKRNLTTTHIRRFVAEWVPDTDHYGHPIHWEEE